MIEFTLHILVSVATLAIMLLSTHVLREAGGYFYTASALILKKIPYISPVLDFTFNGIFHISFLMKSIGLTISSSGMILPILAAQNYKPHLLQDSFVLVGILLASTEKTLEIMHRVHLMIIPDYHTNAPVISKWLNVDITETGDHIMVMRLKRALYLDATIIDLLTIIVCYGISFACALHFWPVADTLIPTPVNVIENVLRAFNYLRFTFNEPITPLAPAGKIIVAFYSLCLLVFTTFFISLSSKLIDEVPTSPEPPQSPSFSYKDEVSLQKEMERVIFESLEKQKAAQQKHAPPK